MYLISVSTCIIYTHISVAMSIPPTSAFSIMCLYASVCHLHLHLHLYIYFWTICTSIIYLYLCLYMNHLHPFIHQSSSVQSLSRVRLYATPWTAAHQASLSISNSQSLLKLMTTELVMPSNHLILCCPLLHLPSVFPRKGN